MPRTCALSITFNLIFISDFYGEPSLQYNYILTLYTLLDLVVLLLRGVTNDEKVIRSSSTKQVNNKDLGMMIVGF